MRIKLKYIENFREHLHISTGLPTSWCRIVSHRLSAANYKLDYQLCAR